MPHRHPSADPVKRAPAHNAVRAVLVLVASLPPLAPFAVAAQTPGREPAVVEIAPGARALGLGMALQVGSNDPDLAFVHPALVQGLQGLQFGYTRLGEHASGYGVSAAGDWFGGGVALSVRALEYPGETGGPGLRERGLDDFLSDPAGGPGVSESAATVTYGRNLFGVQFGLSGRLFTQRHGDVRSTGQSADVGAATSAGPLQVALSVRNLGGDPDLPEEVVLGAGAYGQPLGPVDIGLAAQVRYRDDGEFVAGGGLEVGYWPIRGRTFVGRVGFRNVPEGDASPLTLGGSFWGDSLVLDYAWQPVDGLDGIHRISVGWR